MSNVSIVTRGFNKDARNQQRFNAVPFKCGPGASRNAKGKKRRPAKKNNSARKGKATASAHGNMNGAGVESFILGDEREYSTGLTKMSEISKGRCHFV